MKLEGIKNKFKNIISAAEKVVAKNHTLPILNLIILKADNNLLTIKATNLEVGLEGYLPVKVLTPGLVAINAQILNQFLNTSPKDDEKIQLELDDNNLIIKTNKSTSVIKTYPTDDFPLIPKIKQPTKINLPISDLVVGIKSVIYAAALSDIKPEIASVYIYHHQGKLIFVSTDSFRLAEKKVTSNLKDNFQPLIIPLKNIIEIIKVLELEDGEVEIDISDNQISFITNNFYLTTRIINSSFPDYLQIIPKEFKTEVEVNKDELLDSLKLSNIFSDKFNQVTISVKPNGVEITSNNQDVGKSNIHLTTSVVGDELMVNFNARYILESLPFFSGEKLKLGFSERNKMLLMRGGNDQSFQYLVMPVNR